MVAAGLIVPVVMLAAEPMGAVYQVKLFPDVVGIVLDFVHLVIALFAAFYAVKLATLSQGGSFEKTWNLVAAVAVIFAVHGAFHGFAMLGLVDIEGIREIFELVLAILLLVLVVTTRRNLLKNLFGK